jgi:hypothetical protein
MPQSKNPEEQLAAFMGKYLPEIGAQAEAILARMRRRYPTAFELVYDNYNALAVGFGPTEKTSEAIFSIALYPRWVSLFFLQAKGLRDPQKLLRGSGNVARHIVLATPSMLNDPAVMSLMQEAVERARVPFPPKGARRLIIKSISARQRPRRPAAKGAKSSGARSRKGAKKKRSSRSPSRST